MRIASLLLATFLGIGMVVNGLIAYIVVLALGERQEAALEKLRAQGDALAREAIASGKARRL